MLSFVFVPTMKYCSMYTSLKKSGGRGVLDGITFRNWLQRETIMHQLHNYTANRIVEFVYILSPPSLLSFYYMEEQRIPG